MNTQTKLVIFDCDGVLINSESLSAEVLISALGDLGVEVDFDYFCTNYVGRSFPSVAQDIRVTFDLDLPDDFEQNYRRVLLERFAAELTLTEGVQDILGALTTPCCVATSSSPARVSHSLSIVGLSARFGQDVFTASEVPNGKPAPDLFLHAAAKMGVDPAHCLVIEDSLPGVEAAHAANMPVLRYTGGAHLAARVLKHAADVQSFQAWDELPKITPALFA
jgi:HAD superfamily hydrolase (TIGR01509 family)